MMRLAISAAAAGALFGGSQCSAAPGDSQVYQAVSSKVTSLAAQLSEMELANSQALVKLQHQYAQEVEDGKKRISAIEADNGKIQEEIYRIENENKELRRKAERMRQDVKSWESDFQSVRANFSTSLEFTGDTLKRLVEGQASEAIEILAAFDRLEQARADERTHQKRVEMVRNAARTGHNKDMALLQVPDVASNPSAFIRALGGDLDDMRKRHDLDKQRLKAQFKQQVEEIRTRSSKLMQQQQALIAHRDESKAVQGKLREAVAFLETTLHALESNARSLRLFASRIGIRPVPHRPQRLSENSADDTKDAATLGTVKV